MHIERTITLNYYIYKFIDYELNIYMNVTYLNLELGAPLTHLNHVSTFLQVSVEPSVESAFVWSGTWNGNRLSDCKLSLI